MTDERTRTDEHTTALRQALSALADGEADAAAAASVTSSWRDDAALRGRWHAYQVIGDVLRSDELAACRGDAAFLRRLRERLEREPVVFAPADVQPAAEPAQTVVAMGGARTPRARIRRWAPPAAVAAGFVAVAGALTVLRTPDVPAPGREAQLAAALQPAPQAAQLAAVAAPQLVGPVAGPEVLASRDLPADVPANVLIRDARIDEYLAAHKQFGGSSALGLPSGFLRSATYQGPGSVAPASR